MSTASAALRSPPEIARETIRQLALRKLSPTPDNYATLYDEVSGGGKLETPTVLQWLRQLCLDLGQAANAPSIIALEKAVHARDAHLARTALVALCVPSQERQRSEWAPLVRDLLRLWDMRHAEWTQARKRESIEHVLTAFGADPGKLAVKLGALLKAWSERGTSESADLSLVDAKPKAADGDAHATPIDTAAATALTKPPGDVANSIIPTATTMTMTPSRSSMAESASRDSAAYLQLRDLSAELLKLVIGEGTHGDERLIARGLALITRLQSAGNTTDFAQLAPAIRELLRQVERAQGTQRETVQGLLGLLHLIVSNIEELVPDERWVKGQVGRLRELIAEPLDARSLAEAEQAFRDVIIRQGSIRKSLDEAKAALKDMLTSFIGRLGTISESTGEYQGKVRLYAEQIEKVDDLSQLPAIIKGLLDDTRAVQTDMLRTREELLDARRRATGYEQQIATLERELVDVSTLLKSDQLTGVLNRRGLNEAFTVESARSDRDGKSMCVALLDVDNFKTLNDTHGHAVGDRALQHLANVVRETVRPTDIVARYGGEEFVVLLPQTSAADAVDVMTRVQRQLTRAFFLQNNERLLITFSAGLTERGDNEPQSAVLTRADEALYQAKGSGKNRVVRV